MESQRPPTSATMPQVAKNPLARTLTSSGPLALGLGAAGVAVLGGIIKGILGRKKRVDTAKAANEGAVLVSSSTTDPVVSQATPIAVDLSPFGSPVGSTPVRLAANQRPEKTRMATRAPMSDVGSEADDQSDNASVRDQRHNFVDASQLQNTLKQMQEMAEENRKLSAFLAEYKADAEKLSKLEYENRALRDVTRQLEHEIQDLKTQTLPRTGAELEVFKNSVRVSAVARSVCSNDESIGLGISTASVDAAIPDGRVRRNNVFKQLLATLQGTASVEPSQPATPRSVSGGGAGGDDTGVRRRKQPRPEDAAVLGQAVYQLLDQFGGRML